MHMQCETLTFTFYSMRDDHRNTTLRPL